MDSTRESLSPQPPAITLKASNGRTSMNRLKKSAVAQNALAKLKARRECRKNPQEFRNRLQHLVGDGTIQHDKSPPITFDDIRDITFCRSRLLKWFMDPLFEDLLPGCFVRLGIYQHRDGNRKYRLYMVKQVQASDPSRAYNFENHKTYKYLALFTSIAISTDICKLTEVSDSPPLEIEFQEWLQRAESSGMRIPLREEVMKKKKEVCNAQKVQPNQAELRAIRILEINRQNRMENFRVASEAKPINTELKPGDVGYDPLSRCRTRPRKVDFALLEAKGSKSCASAGAGAGSSAGAEDGILEEGNLVDTEVTMDEKSHGMI